MDARSRAKELLAQTRRAPAMYASRREAFLAHVCGIVSVVDESFRPIDFYAKHAGTYGARYVTLDDEVDDDWAYGVVDDALTLLSQEST